MADDDDELAGLSETERAIAITKRKHKQEEERFIEEYLERREREREQLEQELEDLKERQVRRIEEREADEARMQEMLDLAEQRRRQEEDERKRKIDEAKRKKEAERKKKQALMAGGMNMMGVGDGKPNYVLPEKKATSDEIGIKPMSGSGETVEDFQRAKAEYMEQFQGEAPGLEDLDESGLRTRIQALHKRIVTLEATRYDLEQKQKIQDMDLKELNERKKQRLRQLALKKGLDPEEYASAKHPFKINVASAYDRQIDRRSYGERKDYYVPKPPKGKALYHGSGRPPTEWVGKAANLDELQQLKKLMEDNPTKYEEQFPVEGAKPPMKPIPMKPPAEDQVDEIPKLPERLPPPPPEKAPEPEPEPPAAEPEPEPEAEEEPPAEE